MPLIKEKTKLRSSHTTKDFASVRVMCNYQGLMRGGLQDPVSREKASCRRNERNSIRFPIGVCVCVCVSLRLIVCVSVSYVLSCFQKEFALRKPYVRNDCFKISTLKLFLKPVRGFTS